MGIRPHYVKLGITSKNGSASLTKTTTAAILLFLPLCIFAIRYADKGAQTKSLKENKKTNNPRNRKKD